MLHYEFIDNNKPETLVLLHGYLGKISFWKAFISPLSTIFNILLIDLPGHGESTIWKADNTLDEWAKGVGEEIAHVVKDPVHIVGHSLGAYIGVKIARKKYAPVASLSLISAPNVSNSKGGMESLLEKKPYSQITGNDIERIVEAMFKRLEVSVDLKKINLADNPSLWKIILDVYDYDFQFDIQMLRANTLLLCPALDTSVRIDAYQSIAEKNKNITVIEIPNAKHAHFPNVALICDSISNFVNS